MIKSAVACNLLYSQLIIYLTFITCIALAPASLSDNSGFSYFGHHELTVAPFIIGLIGAAYFLLRAADGLSPGKTGRILAYGFRFMAILMVGVAVVPAIGNGWYDLIHRLFGSLLFITELSLSVWLLRQAKGLWPNYFVFLLQMLGGVLALIYLSPAQGFELQGQLLFQLAFSFLLFRNLKYIPARTS